MSADWKSDLDAVDPGTVERFTPLYPVAQWLNGDPKMAAVGGVVHTGGVILPQKYVDDSVAPAPGWARTTVAFSSGKSEPMLACPKPRLAIIRTRFRWFVNYNGVTTFYPRASYVPDSGMRGHLQALCGVHGYDFPVVVTFKGKASQEFEKLLKDWSQKVMGAANKVTGQTGTMPRFAFYLRLAPGPHIKVGQKGQESIVTPPVLELPAVISDDYLSKIYVGRDKLVEFQQVYRDASEWAEAWGRPGAEETPEDHDAPPPADLETGEVVDVWSKTQAEGAIKAAGVKDSDFRNALQRANGSFDYVPARDTGLARKLVQNALAQF